VLRETATTLSTTPWYSIFECYDVELYLRMFELETAEKIKHSVHSNGSSRPDSKKSFNENSVSYIVPTRRAFHTFDALTARFEKKAQIHFVTLV